MTLINDCKETQNERNASKSYLTTQNRSNLASKIDLKKKKERNSMSNIVTVNGE